LIYRAANSGYVKKKKLGGKSSKKRKSGNGPCHFMKKWKTRTYGDGLPKIGRIHTCNGGAHTSDLATRILNEVVEFPEVRDLDLMITGGGFGVVSLGKPLSRFPPSAEEFDGCLDVASRWCETLVGGIQKPLPFALAFGLDVEGKKVGGNEEEKVAQLGVFLPKGKRRSRIIAAKRLPNTSEWRYVYTKGAKHGLPGKEKIPLLGNALLLICHDGNFLNPRGIKRQKRGGRVWKQRGEITSDFESGNIESIVNLVHYDPDRPFMASYNATVKKSPGVRILAGFKHTDEKALEGRLGRYFVPRGLSVLEIYPIDIVP
jgi:hypothetical protein